MASILESDEFQKRTKNLARAIRRQLNDIPWGFVNVDKNIFRKHFNTKKVTKDIIFEVQTELVERDVYSIWDEDNSYLTCCNRTVAKESSYPLGAKYILNTI